MTIDTGSEESSNYSLRRYLTHLQQLQGLRTRRLGTGRVLLIAGALMVPLGVCLILLAWQGASNTPLVFEQIPYMISGGLLGLGLMVLGGLVYFGYWLSLLVKESRLERREMIALLSDIRTRLDQRPVIPPDPEVASTNGSARRRRTARPAS
jgi:hypothetical protein